MISPVTADANAQLPLDIILDVAGRSHTAKDD